MTFLSRTLYTLGIGLLTCLPAGVMAQEQEQELPPARSFSITSPAKCLEQLDPSEAAEIRSRFDMPYQECQRRLARKKMRHLKAGDDAAQEQGQEPSGTASATAAASADKDAPPPAVNARNYLRVQESVKKPATPATDAESGLKPGFMPLFRKDAQQPPARKDPARADALNR